MPDFSDIQVWADTVATAVTSSNWRYLAALLIVGLVSVGGRFLGRRLPFFLTSAGKAVLSLSVALLGALATTLASGKIPGFKDVIHALGLAWIASGGWSQVKAVVEYFEPKAQA